MPKFASMFDDASTMTGGSTTVCPYCKVEKTYQGDPLGDYESTEIECGNCDKVFQVTATWSVSFHCRPEVES